MLGFVATLALAGIGTLVAQVDARPALGGGGILLLEKGDHKAAFVEPETFSIVARVDTGRGPHEVVVSPDGDTAFVSNYGGWRSDRPAGPPRLEPGNTISVIDTRARAVRATWNLGEYRLPHGLALSSDGRRLLVTAEGKQALVELDAEKGSVEKVWSIAQHVSHMVAVTPDGSRAYVANVASGSVTVLDRRSGKARTVTTGDGSEGLALSPGGGEVWVADRAADAISIVDTATGDVAATVPSGGRFPIRLAFAPDGATVWVSNANSSTVTALDARTRAVVASIDVPANPIGLAFRPDGARLYVACSGANLLAEIDPGSKRVARTLATGEEPDGVAWIPAPRR